MVDQLILDDVVGEMPKPDANEADLAATKIQAAMKGYKTRKKIKSRWSWMCVDHSWLLCRSLEIVETHIHGFVEISFNL